MQARTGAIGSIAFGHFLEAYRPLRHLANVRTFTQQVKAVRLFTAAIRRKRTVLVETEVGLALGQCVATIAYGQLVAENAWRLEVPGQLVSVIFHLLVNDLSALALSLASSPHLNRLERLLLRRAVSLPTTSGEDWGFVGERLGDGKSEI